MTDASTPYLIPLAVDVRQGCLGKNSPQNFPLAWFFPSETEVEEERTERVHAIRFTAFLHPRCKFRCKTRLSAFDPGAGCFLIKAMESSYPRGEYRGKMKRTRATARPTIHGGHSYTTIWRNEYHRDIEERLDGQRRVPLSRYLLVSPSSSICPTGFFISFAFSNDALLASRFHPRGMNSSSRGMKIVVSSRIQWPRAVLPLHLTFNFFPPRIKRLSIVAKLHLAGKNGRSRAKSPWKFLARSTGLDIGKNQEEIV